MGGKRKSSRKEKDERRGTRRTGVKQPRELIDLIVEGATEKAYLQALLDYRYRDVFAPQWHGSGSGSHTSLKNLLNRAQCEEREGRCRGTIWVVCDVDDNETHRELLMKWRAADSDHRSALQGVSIEGWFLQHLDKPSRPTSSGEALRLVKRQWGGYKKGGEVQKWLIERTDEACRRERQFLGGARNDDVWPVDRSSQMPLLITYLDERARDWALRDSGGGCVVGIAPKYVTSTPPCGSTPVMRTAESQGGALWCGRARDSDGVIADQGLGLQVFFQAVLAPDAAVARHLVAAEGGVQVGDG